MYTFIIFVGLFGLFLAHELGHYFVMRRYGIEVTEIGFGMPIPMFPYLLINLPKQFGSTIFRINPIPILAYVKQSESGLEREKLLPYASRAHINAAGIVVNICLFWIFEFANLSLQGEWLPAILCGLICWLCWKFSKFFGAYIVPVLSIISLVAITFLVLKTPLVELGYSSYGRMASDISDNVQLLPSLAGISFALAIVNMLPISICDGGHTVGILIERFFPKCAFAFQYIGVVLFFALIVLGFVADIVRFSR